MLTVTDGDQTRLRVACADWRRRRPLSGVRRSSQETSCSIRRAYRLHQRAARPWRPAGAGSECSVRRRQESASERRRYSESLRQWEAPPVHCIGTCRTAMFTSAHHSLVQNDTEKSRVDFQFPVASRPTRVGLRDQTPFSGLPTTSRSDRRDPHTADAGDRTPSVDARDDPQLNCGYILKPRGILFDFLGCTVRAEVEPLPQQFPVLLSAV